MKHTRFFRKLPRSIQFQGLKISISVSRTLQNKHEQRHARAVDTSGKQKAKKQKRQAEQHDFLALWEITFASGCGFGCPLHRCDHAASSFPMHPLTCVVVAHSESDFREGSTCGSAVSGVAKLRTAGSA